jgi:2-dehydro-3-deoxygluconokinase
MGSVGPIRARTVSIRVAVRHGTEEARPRARDGTVNAARPRTGDHKRRLLLEIAERSASCGTLGDYRSYEGTVPSVAISSTRRVVTFGEVMLRLAATEGTRLVGARNLEATFGGGEANVAASVAGFGMGASFVSQVPDNDLGESVVRFLRELGVDTSGVGVAPGRLGIYFLEPGASQRASRVLYDRADSCVATAAADAYPWARLLDGAAWFHTTGITPALSAAAADAALTAVRAARESGATVSVDLNYRAKLWSWGASPSAVMSDIVGEADVLIGNEEDADKIFGIRAPGSAVSEGRVDPAGYASVAVELAERFPRLHTIAFTQRGSISASENTWSGVLWTREAFHIARTYRISPIVDRVGAGDAFAAGLIYALLDGRRPAAALEFAVAASCLKHTIRGDVNRVTVAEVDALAAGAGSGRVER